MTITDVIKQYEGLDTIKFLGNLYFDLVTSFFNFFYFKYTVNILLFK